MTEFIRRLLRATVMIIMALAGLFMALIFTFSTLVAITVLFVFSRLRGQQFAAKEYWSARQSKHKPHFGQGSLNRKDVTDIEARDIR